MELVVSIVGRFYDFSKHNNPKSKPEEKTAQEPIRVKMVDLLPSLTDTEEKLFDESNLLHLSTKRGKEKMIPWWISVTILLLSYHPLVRYLCRFQNIKNLGKLLSDFL